MYTHVHLGIKNTVLLLYVSLDPKYPIPAGQDYTLATCSLYLKKSNPIQQKSQFSTNIIFYV